MLAQVVLTPTESKKLIAKAIARLDVVRQAAIEGIVVLHPGSSPYFVIEEITGKKPETDFWVCGAVTPKGMCGDMGVRDYLPHSPGGKLGEFRNHWIIKNGKLSVGEPLSEWLEHMRPTDVYIKGVNALDPQGHVGILIGDPRDGGPLGWVVNAWREKNFNLIFPAGLEKLIPISISEAAKEAKQAKYDYGMGTAAGLYPCPTTARVVTELDAIKILSGGTAIPVAAGGLGGAEGAITLVITGGEKEVKKAIDFVEQSKGARLPQLRLSNCKGCPRPCRFPVGDKHWAFP
jgi:hypothetical protein